jgi:hypothetical protein
LGPFAQVVLHGILVKLVRLHFYNPEGPGGAVPKAGTKTVAVFFRHQLGLPVDDLNGAFSARRHALSAAIATFIVYFNDLS